MERVIRNGYDTFVGSIHPDREHGDDKFLVVQADSQYALLYFPIPESLRGAVVSEVELILHAKGASTGARDITARRNAERWSPARANWKNKPGVVGTAKTTTVGDLTDGAEVRINVTQHAQTVIDNNFRGHFGWRISTTGAQHKFYGLDAGVHKPRLRIVWSDKPGTPTDLVPEGTVGVPKPFVSASYGDTSGDEIIAIKVDIDPNKNASAPAWTSGELAAEVPELDLAGTAWAGLAEGATTYWRMHVKGVGGRWSDPSPWAKMKLDSKGTLTIDNPAPGASPFVNDVTPTILATLTGETLEHQQVRITKGNDRTAILFDSGKIKATDPAVVSQQIPFKHEKRRVLRDDKEYWLNVRAWDAKAKTERVATPGDPVFVGTWVKFTVNDDPTINPVSSLTVTQEGATPGVRLNWTRGDAADSWTILRDGVVVATQLQPEDTLVSGTSHTWIDWEATPFETHDYNVKAVVNKKQSPKGPTISVRTEPGGVWIVDFEDNLSFSLGGTDIGDWEQPEQAAFYHVVGSTKVIKRTSGKHGVTGSFEGALEATQDRTLRSFKNHLTQIAEHPTKTVQLIAADMSVPVVLTNLTMVPHEDTHPDHLMEKVSFLFHQDGEGTPDFDPVI